MFTFSKIKRNFKEYEEKILSWINDILKTTGAYDNSELNLIQIMVSEIECRDPNCVPIETFVIIFGNNQNHKTVENSSSTSRWTGKILKPMNEVTQTDVAQLLICSDILNITTSKPLISHYISTKTSSTTQSKNNAYNIDEQKCDNIVSESTKDIQSFVNTLDLFLKQEPTVINNQEKIKYIESIQTILNSYTSANNIAMSDGSLSSDSFLNSTNSNYGTEDNIITVSMVPKYATSENSNIQNNTHENSTSNESSNNNQTKNIANLSIFTSVATNTMSNKPMMNASSLPSTTKARHDKGVRPRGCPCCDPDNIDNIVDNLLFLEAMP